VINSTSTTRVCLQLGVVLFTAALAGSALATSRGASGHDGCVSVPFKGESSGVITATGFDPVAGIAFAHIEGEGRATHFGRLTVSGDVALDVVTGVPQGTWTLTAANGDMLFLDMTAVPGIGLFTVTGGTGRFEGASGFYKQFITFAAPPGTVDVNPYSDVLEGTICLAH
jgi:hypothetical protein